MNIFVIVINVWQFNNPLAWTTVDSFNHEHIKTDDEATKEYYNNKYGVQEMHTTSGDFVSVDNDEKALERTKGVFDSESYHYAISYEFGIKLLYFIAIKNKISYNSFADYFDICDSVDLCYIYNDSNQVEMKIVNVPSIFYQTNFYFCRDSLVSIGDEYFSIEEIMDTAITPMPLHCTHD